MMLTVTASEARANFSKLGEEIVRTGEPVTVFKNSKPWLMISPMSDAGTTGNGNLKPRDRKTDSELNASDKESLIWAEAFVEEYADVFEVLAK